MDLTGPMRRTAQRAIWLVAAAAVSACSTSPSATYLARYQATNMPSSFRVCSDFGCGRDTVVVLDEGEWRQIGAIFSPVATDAAAEREQIRAAIANFEMVVGPKTDTQNDEAGAALFSFDPHGQMDCIDEAYNTSTYLRLLAMQGLLHWHTVGLPVMRGHLIDRWPHNTATITELGTSDTFAVDSWFHANGAPPEIVALAVWRSGWHPEQR
jgi:hypothetical protein